MRGRDVMHSICFDAAGNPVPPEGVDPELWNLELPSILGIAWRGEYSGDEGDVNSDACGSSVMSYNVDGSGVEHSPDMHDIMEYDLHKASAEGVIYGQGHAPSMQRWSLPDKDHVYMLETRPLPATCPPVHPAELLAYRILHRGSIHVEQFMQLVLQLPESGSRKRKCAQASADHIRQMSFSVGAYTLGGLHGVMKATRSFPWVARLLAAVVRGSCYNHVFSAVGLHLNTKMTPHVDIHNSPSCPSLLLPCTRWRGGGGSGCQMLPICAHSAKLRAMAMSLMSRCPMCLWIPIACMLLWNGTLRMTGCSWWRMLLIGPINSRLRIARCWRT